MAEGRSNQGIADEIAVTLRTVEKYVLSIFTKLDLPTTTGEWKRVLQSCFTCAAERAACKKPARALTGALDIARRPPGARWWRQTTRRDPMYHQSHPDRLIRHVRAQREYDAALFRLTRVARRHSRPATRSKRAGVARPVAESVA